jgi:phenylpropionate dioxygenase-like ring-hydroxylating dioxygenase large terminal subunit
MAGQFSVASEDPLIVVEDTAPDWRRRQRISSERYFSREYLARERAWFTGGWVFVGSKGQAPRDGDFITFDLMDQSILIVNQGGGVFRAFHNVCSHRGRRLVDDAAGNAERFRCTFHEWTYALDGSLRGVPYAKSFVDLDRSQCNLRPVRLDSWGHMLFANLDGQATSLTEYLGALRHCFEGWLDVSQPYKNRSIEQDSNWKLVLDNFYEFYHLDGLHPQRKGKLLAERGAFALFERHALQVNPYATGAAWAQERTNDWRRWLEVPHTRDCPLSFHLSLFPNTSIHVNPAFGGISVIQAVPHPADPARCTLNLWNLAMDDGPPDLSIREQGAQDFRNCPPHMAGLRSEAFGQQILSLYECRVSHFHAALDAHIGVA